MLELCGLKKIIVCALYTETATLSYLQRLAFKKPHILSELYS